MNKQPNLAALNEWICISSMVVIAEDDFVSRYIEGQKYWFHEDNPPNSQCFKLVVDETDTPIKKYVRWD